MAQLLITYLFDRNDPAVKLHCTLLDLLASNSGGKQEGMSISYVELTQPSPSIGEESDSRPIDDLASYVDRPLP